MMSLRLGFDEVIIRSGKASTPGQPMTPVLATTERSLPEFGDLDNSC